MEINSVAPWENSVFSLVNIILTTEFSEYKHRNTQGRIPCKYYINIVFETISTKVILFY